MVVSATVEARLDWSYDVRSQQIMALYERAKTAQWNAATDIDWSQAVEFGGPLPPGSPYAVAEYERSPLHRYGRPLWDAFRWEFQAWIVSQFLHGEQGALVATARLAEMLPGPETKYFAASQVGDEARHVEAFSRYVRTAVPDPYPVSPSLDVLLRDVLSDGRWDVVALGMQIVIEGLAMASLRLADASLHDPLIKQITRLVARDEARHVAFGVLALQQIYPQLTTAELAEREEFLLEAAELMRRRFLLGEIWQRLGVDAAAGREFAAESGLMVRYRQSVFARVISSLEHVGLLSPGLYERLDRMDLVGGAGRLVAAARQRR
jgi:P-aminobenzoate N-oxygenase AurF